MLARCCSSELDWRIRCLNAVAMAALLKMFMFAKHDWMREAFRRESCKSANLKGYVAWLLG